MKPRDYIERSRACEAAGQNGEALQIAETAAREHPASVAVQQHLSSLLGRSGRLPEAEATLRGALAHNPGHPRLSISLAGVCARQKRFGEALELAEHAAPALPASASAQRLLARLRRWAAGKDSAFDSVWSPDDKDRARSLLGRMMAIADSIGVRLYLDGGTLLGHIRERRILPWDDDIDLVMVGGEGAELLAERLNEAGLCIESLGHKDFLKVFDPAYEPVTAPQYRHTWPNVDISVFNERDGRLVCDFEGHSFARDPFCPGHRILFETVWCWTPERPAEVLDAYYKTWRTVERSNHWDHRNIKPIEFTYDRPIQTDASGRKVQSVPATTSAKVRMEP